MSTVAVVATGHANVRSLLNALERLGIHAELTQDPKRVRQARRLILPGVGAFGAVMQRLAERELVGALRERLASDGPLLGICLGLQLLLDSSEESPGVPGLSAIPGRVVRLAPPGGLKVPHVGWNRVEPLGQDPVLGGRPFHAYFVHSFAAEPASNRSVVGCCDYGGRRFPAALRRGNTVAVQFHPERSGPAGLALLRRFLEEAP